MISTYFCLLYVIGEIRDLLLNG